MTDLNLINKCEDKLIPYFKAVEEIALYNQEKVLKPFKKIRLHFAIL